MKKTYVWIVVLVVVVAGGLTWYLVAHKSKTTNDNNMSSMNMGKSSSTNSNQAATNTDSVTIQNYAFSPANITVKAGSTVTWTNKDSVAHTVTETDGKAGPSSGDVNPGSTYSFTFKTPGTYHYHCSIHLEMIGTVTVTS
jgi:plastocyanin